MSSNSMTDYVEAFRANLPAGITFDATLNRYFCNDKRYLNEWEVEAYLNYIKKFGFTAIPDVSAYAVGGLEPPLVLDFDETFYRTGGTATDLVSAATHTRASSATYVDADGILQTAAINEPRVGHHIWNGSTWVDAGYFHESEASTNLVTYSNDFIEATTIKTNVTVTSTAVVSPTGGTDATLVTATASSDEHRLYKSAATSAVYTRSVYAKAGTANFIALSSGTTAIGYAVFDLSLGVVAIESNAGPSSIEDVGNGWYRCAVRPSTKGAFFAVNMGDTALNAVPQTAWLGAGETVYIFGAQMETPTHRTSYIPTTGASATRAADVMTIPSANLPWNPLAVSIQMEGTITYAQGFLNELVNWQLSSTDKIKTFIDSRTKLGQVLFDQEALNVHDRVPSAVDAYSPGINVPFNIASRHGSTFINGAVDGTALTANTTPTALPDLSATDMQIGSDFMGTIKLFRVWADDLTDEGIEEASA